MNVLPVNFIEIGKYCTMMAIMSSQEVQLPDHSMQCMDLKDVH